MKKAAMQKNRVIQSEEQLQTETNVTNISNPVVGNGGILIEPIYLETTKIIPNNKLKQNKKNNLLGMGAVIDAMMSIGGAINNQTIDHSEDDEDEEDNDEDEDEDDDEEYDEEAEDNYNIDDDEVNSNEEEHPLNSKDNIQNKDSSLNSKDYQIGRLAHQQDIREEYDEEDHDDIQDKKELINY